MKKIAITGMIIFLVMFVVTCDGGLTKGEEAVEYTDVVYSEDGSQITLYLDGVGVPKTQAQRAITRDLAKMAYDYFEVIFIARTGSPGPTSDVIARAQWELGQSAGISGVYRGTASETGHDYIWAPGKINNVALMFVGTKNDKTLLGVGKIAEVDHSAATSKTPLGWDEAVADGGYSNPFVPGNDDTTAGKGIPNTVFAYIRPNTASVTFYVDAVKTGLLIEDEIAGTNESLILTDSFNFTGNGTTTGYTTREDHSIRQAPSSGSSALYPIYSLPEIKKSVQLAEYAFDGAAETFAKEIRFNAAATKSVGSGFEPAKGIAIEKRFPRYLEGGRYRALKENIDTDTTVVLDTTITGGDYTALIEAGDPLIPTIPLKFTTQGTGVFSFYIDIPVYMITTDEGTNSGTLQAIVWKLRTGLGSELYSIDSGKSSGGCVLMGIGKIDLDWLEIYWNWLDD